MTERTVGGFRPERELADDLHPIRIFGATEAQAFGARARSSDARYIVRRALDNPPSDQGRYSSCVGNGTADALEILMPVREDISRLFIYWNARRLNGDENKDAGSYIRLTAQSIVDHGVCRETAWGYDQPVNERPDLGAYEEAYDHRLGYSPILGAQLASYRITSTGSTRGDDVEAAVRADHPVILGVDVGEPFADYFAQPGGHDMVWSAPHRPIGKHCMAIVGVRRVSTGDRIFLLRNSWGPNGLAGYPGHAWMSSSWLDTADDLTVLTVAPEFAARAHLDTDPAPAAE